MFELKEFKDLKINLDNKYSAILPSYKIDDDIFYMELNFYTQLENIKLQYLEYFDQIINSILEITKKNHKVYFVADFDHPLLELDDVIYRDINDVLAFNKLTFDLKINPDSDWKD